MSTIPTSQDGAFFFQTPAKEKSLAKKKLLRFAQFWQLFKSK